MPHLQLLVPGHLRIGTFGLAGPRGTGAGLFVEVFPLSSFCWSGVAKPFTLHNVYLPAEGFSLAMSVCCPRGHDVAELNTK